AQSEAPVRYECGVNLVCGGSMFGFITSGPAGAMDEAAEAVAKVLAKMVANGEDISTSCFNISLAVDRVTAGEEVGTIVATASQGGKTILNYMRDTYGSIPILKGTIEGVAEHLLGAGEGSRAIVLGKSIWGERFNHIWNTTVYGGTVFFVDANQPTLRALVN